MPLSGMALGRRQDSHNTSIAPVVIPASQDWDGNDGPWSSFTIQIGTPPQVMKILISTAATQTWVVLPQGCTNSDPSNCGLSRGNLFLVNESSTWQPNTASLNSSIYNLGLEGSLGYTGNGLYGFDDVALGWPGSGGPALQNQTIAGIATKDFYIGVFGLHPGTSNFTTWDDPIPSYIQNARNQSLIPSKSWSYTAGNQYRLNSVLGSLVLGGYDASKFAPNNISFPFNEEDVRDLTIHIDGISLKDSFRSSSLLPNSLPAYIDSTVPHIWLPVEACALFEDVLGLTYDDVTELYLINDTQHANLLSQNPSFTFTLGNLTAGEEVNITLPYAAFDLSVSYPIVANSTRYFPLKRAANATQYTLGRTFFQEAYVTADYERRTFSVSQCTWDAAAKADIIPIYPPSPKNTTGSAPVSTSSGTPSSTPSSSFTLSAGTIAGISIAIAAIIVLLAIIVSFLIHKRQRARRAKLLLDADAGGFLKPELDAQESQLKIVHEADGEGTQTESEVDGRPIYETEGEWRMTAEMDGRERCVYEMPAREEVAAEIGENDEMGYGQRGKVKGRGSLVGTRDAVTQERGVAEVERDDASSIQEEHQFSVGRAHS